MKADSKNKIHTGLKSSSIENIPKGWTTQEFGKTFEFLSTFSFSRDNLSEEKTKDEIRYIHYGDIHSTFENGILNFDTETRMPFLKDGFINHEDLKHKDFPLLKDGDLVVADASEDYAGVAECVELKNLKRKKVLGGLHTFVARDVKCQTAEGYRTYVLKHPSVIKEIRRRATGFSVYGISKKNLAKVKLTLPSIPEQRAIAAILGKWDESISQTQQLITQLQQRNKWLIQNLLTGKKRLKGFGREKWKKVRLIEVAKELSIKNGNDKDLTVLSCSKHRGLVPSLEYFSKRIYSSDLTTYKIVPRNCFAYATNHIEEGSIGYQSNYKEALISPMYTVFKTDHKLIDDDFLFRLLKSHSYIHEYQKRMEGSIDRRGGLRWDEFSKIKIPLFSMKEQEKIASILSQAHKEVEMLEEKRAALKEQKKGLMQQLLTGRKRIKYEN